MSHPLLRTAAAVAAVATLAGSATAQTVSSFNGTYSNNNGAGAQRLTDLVARGDQVTPGTLGGGGSALFTATLRIDRASAGWPPGNANIFVMGFAPNVTPTTAGVYNTGAVGAPLLYFQANQADGSGYCMGTDFWRSGPSFNIERGTNAICAGASTSPAGGGQYVRFSMLLNGDGSWTGGATFLQDDGTPLVGSVGTWRADADPTGTRSTQNGLVLNGTQLADAGAVYTPFLRVSPSYASGNQGYVTVSDASLTTTVGISAVPEPATVALTGAGLLGLAAAARRRRARAAA